MERKINKTMVGMVAVLMVTLLYHFTQLNYGYFSIITTFMLIQGYYSDIYLKTVERIVGPLIAFIITFLGVYFLSPYFTYYLMFSIFFIMFFAYCYARSYYSYAMLLAVITSALMSCTGYVDSPSAGVQLGFYWALNSIVGALVVLVVDLSFKKALRFPIKLAVLKQNFNTVIPDHFWKAIGKIDTTAFLIATRITLTILIITALNHSLGWDYLNLQAIVAGTISSAQLTQEKANQKIIFRLVGIVLGTLIAILCVLVLLMYPSFYLEMFFIVSILTLCIFLSEKFPHFDYVFLHLGIIIPLILIHPITEQYHLELALFRALGSLEGGIISVLMQYLWGVIAFVGSSRNK